MAESTAHPTLASVPGLESAGSLPDPYRAPHPTWCVLPGSRPRSVFFLPSCTVLTPRDPVPRPTLESHLLLLRQPTSA